jgi:hypothetical protein
MQAMPGASCHPGGAALAFFLIPAPQGEGGSERAKRHEETGGDGFAELKPSRFDITQCRRLMRVIIMIVG